MPGEGAPVGEGKRITLPSPIAHHHHHHNVFFGVECVVLWCISCLSICPALLFVVWYITVTTITHVMRMAHMRHHSSWFLVCETIRERREAAAEPSRPWMDTSRRHLPFLFSDNSQGLTNTRQRRKRQQPSATFAEHTKRDND